MLTQLRILYPKASLISEFLTIDQGKYIVRVLIQDDGVTLATALAAADTIEEAEDRARDRVLTIIDFHPPANNNNQIDLAQKFSSVSQEPQLEIAQPSKQISFTHNEPELDESTLLLTKPTTQSNGNLDSVTNSLTEAPKLEAISEKTTTEIEKIEEEAIDFIEIKIKIDQEMKRLKWTQEQGKNYILSNYGKRSRTYLSDEQLLEFLDYLQKQPDC